MTMTIKQKMNRMLTRVEIQNPTTEQLEEWIFNGICEATDGCIVEPDGTCPHGCDSWLIELGLI